MNLQICVPYEKCPYKCPMCIANNRKRFADNYKNANYLYKQRLENIKNNYNYFILTGDTEPTLNSHWLKTVLQVLKGKQIELQTRNYNLHDYNLNHLTTLAYSITKLQDYLKAWSFQKIGGNNRLVILLTKDFEILTADNFNSMGYNQITFKVLQPTNDTKTNEWIQKNQMTDFTNIYDIIDKYNGSEVSIRIDTNCQDSINRYEIFRSDGLIYTDWETTIPK